MPLTPALVVLQPAPEGEERVAQRDVRVLVRPVDGAGPPHGDLPPRDGDVEPDLVQRALPAVAVRGLDRDVAAHDLGREPVEAPGQLPGARGERRRGIHVAECHLQGQSHANLRAAAITAWSTTRGTP